MKITVLDGYLATDGIAEITEMFPQQQEDVNDDTLVESEMECCKRHKEMLLSQVTSVSLLRDKVTSDVILAILDKRKDATIGTFFCHAAVLSDGKFQNVSTRILFRWAAVEK